MPPVGLLVSCPFRRQPCPVRGLWWVVLPVRQLCPLWDTTLMHITISALPLARLDRIELSFHSCRLPDYFIGFTFSLQPCHLPEYQFTTLPLVRLYYIDFGYQPCHLPDFNALFAFYSRATCQTLFSWFQFTVLPLVRPYDIGFSLQPCHRSVFISLVSVCSPDACRTSFHGYSI